METLLKHKSTIVPLATAVTLNNRSQHNARNTCSWQLIELVLHKEARMMWSRYITVTAGKPSSMESIRTHSHLDEDQPWDEHKVFVKTYLNENIASLFLLQFWEHSAEVERM